MKISLTFFFDYDKKTKKVFYKKKKKSHKMLIDGDVISRNKHRERTKNEIYLKLKF